MLVCLFVCLLAWFVGGWLFVGSFGSFVRSFVRSFVCLFVCLFVNAGFVDSGPFSSYVFVQFSLLSAHVNLADRLS